MRRLVDIDDERFWDILFDEACVEGQQANRIMNGLEKIVSYDAEKVVAELENRKEESKKCYVEAMAEANCSLASRFHGEREAYNNSINIIRKGGTT